MDLNPYVFSIDMPRSNLCFKLCFLFKKRHTISDSWITRLQINLIVRYNLVHSKLLKCYLIIIRNKFKHSATQQQDHLDRKFTNEETLKLVQITANVAEKKKLMVQKKIIAWKKVKKRTGKNCTPRRRFINSIGLLQKCLMSTHYKKLKEEGIKLKQLGMSSNTSFERPLRKEYNALCFLNIFVLKKLKPILQVEHIGGVHFVSYRNLFQKL
jgi:hypothetical protein